MATYTADSLVPRVVFPADDELIINELDYMGDGATTFTAGDFIRITTSGQVKLAALDSDTAGAVHGMVLKDYAVAPTTSTPVAVCLFDHNTVIRVQVYDGTAGNAVPSGCVVGTSHVLRNGGSAHWSVILTTTKGIATVTRQPSNANAYDPNLAASKQYGLVDVKFARAILDGRAA